MAVVVRSDTAVNTDAWPQPPEIASTHFKAKNAKLEPFAQSLCPVGRRAIGKTPATRLA